MIADVFDHFPVGALAQIFFFLVGCGSVVVIILTIWKLARDLFGKQPPMNSVLAQINKKLEALPNTFASLALVKEIQAEVRLMTPRTDMAKFEISLTNRFTEFSTYEHSRIHDFGDFLESMRTESLNRGERLAAVEADVKTVTTNLRELNVKTERIVERVGDKVEQLIRDGVIRAARS